MSRPPLLLAALLIAPLVACGGDDSPLLGTWQVATHTRNDTGCASEGAAVTDPPFVKFVMTNIFGRDVVEEVECSAATTCDESGGLFGKFFSEDIPGGLRFQGYTSAGDGTNCTLGSYRSDAVLDASDGLRIESRTYSSAPMQGIVCDPDTAKAMFSSLTCDSLEVMTATRVP